MRPLIQVRPVVAVADSYQCRAARYCGAWCGEGQITLFSGYKSTRHGRSSASADVGDKMLFKALSAEGNPTLTTVHKVLHAMGLRLSVGPERA